MIYCFYLKVSFNKMIVLKYKCSKLQVFHCNMCALRHTMSTKSRGKVHIVKVRMWSNNTIFIKTIIIVESTPSITNLNKNKLIPQITVGEKSIDTRDRALILTPIYKK